MKKKAFTLVEIMIALIIVSVVVSLSIVTFQKTIEANNDKICRQNLKVLQGAIEIYTIENNALPATLSLLTPKQIYLAHEKVIGKPKENRLAGYFNNLIGIKPLFADLGKYYGNDPKVRRCPADKTSATGISSYALDAGSVGSGKTFTNTTELTTKNTGAIIYDDQPWHITYANGITPDGYSGDIRDNQSAAEITKQVRKVAEEDDDEDGELENSECDSKCKAELKKTKREKDDPGDDDKNDR
ncbi:MAG: prepilin-type N-terminal cleavage/methylation domain-containing protein [Candidatus Omnitrophota bacterium]|nr:prepilin-type N-terminal cleavage/methylation domain-containing protein [Candidatus Omnitrophota bacterium]